MNNEIGETAGRIWQYLNEREGATPKGMGKALKLDDALLYMAIGWLAREGKLAFNSEGKSTKFSLARE